MSKLVKFDPFQSLVSFDPFRRFGAWPNMPRWLDELPAEPAIRLDVTEDEKSYKVKADLPGARREDIKVEIEGNQVSLTAEVKRETEEKKGEAVVHSERYYGRQFRSFTLPQPVDREKAQARYADGVLELTLPKNGGTTSKRISIQ